MGYWSDWSVPILVTTAAAFTYIAGLLVWVEGLPWAHVLHAGLSPGGAGLASAGSMGDRDIVLSRLPELLGRRRSHFTSLLQLPTVPTPRPERPFWLLSIYHRHLLETAWAAFPQCPPH